MSITLYNTAELVGVVQTLRPFRPYWLDLFPAELNSTSEEIYFDQSEQLERMAPFVAPNVNGRVMRDQGYTTKMFKPAYVKPKHSIEPRKSLVRMPGEPILGNMTPAQRADAHIRNNLRIESDMIDRRWEWMAARAVIDGSVTVVGEDYPTQTVSFGRSSTLAYSLTSGDRWSVTATADPLGDLQAAMTNAYERSGSPITRITFGLAAWAYFVALASVQALLDATMRGSNADFNRSIATNGEPFQRQGAIPIGGGGMVELYTYNGRYTTDMGSTYTSILDTNTVVGTGPGIQGVKCFGAIMDFDSLEPVSKFPKMWKEEGDPSAYYTMIQSAPLMVPAQPDNSFKILVHQ
jgi:hypothetical protein